MQFPKELQLLCLDDQVLLGSASMKCSSRRNCNPRALREQWHTVASLNEVQLPKELQPPEPRWTGTRVGSLNEVQLPKELQQGQAGLGLKVLLASMKYSSRRNCNNQTNNRPRNMVEPQ